MSIRFAGVDLLLEDPEGTVRRWLDDHLSEVAASIFCMENTAIREGRFGSLRNTGSPVAGSSFASSGFPLSDTATVRRVGLPVGNYPRSPRPRINSLYWPTGATRWAHGLFLITHSNLELVLDACADGHAATFELSSQRETATPSATTSSSLMSGGVSSQITASLFPLAPRPVSVEIAGEEQLWLLPLVDARYFWQYSHVSQYAPTSWSEALSAIHGTSLVDSPSLGEGVPMAYGRPSATEFVRDFENSAILLDAIALTVGRRIVGGPTVSPYQFQHYTTQSASAARVAADENLATFQEVVAGGQFSDEARTLGNPPGRVVVTFGNAAGDRVAGYAEWERADAIPGRSKVFHCSATGGAVSAEGKYTSGPEQALADRVGIDDDAWHALQYDLTCAGVVPWNITGFDDYVRWEMTIRGRGRRRKYLCQTRIVSLPPNFGCESLPLDPLPTSSSSSSESSSSPSSSSSSSSSESSSSLSSSLSSIDSSSSSVSSTSSSEISSSASSAASVSSSASSMASSSSDVSSTSSTTSSTTSSVSSSESSETSSSTLVSSNSSSTPSNSSSAESSSTSSLESSNVSNSSAASVMSSASSMSSISSSHVSSSESSLPLSSNASGASSLGSPSSDSGSSTGSSASSSISSGSQTSSATSGSGGSGSGSGDGSVEPSTTSSDASSVTSGSGSSFGSTTSSGVSSGSGMSETSSASGSSSGCADVVTDVSCSGGTLVVTRRKAQIAFCD